MDQHQHIVCKWFKHLSESLVFAFCHIKTWNSQLVSLPVKHRRVGHDSGWHWCNCRLSSPQIFVFLTGGSICWFCWLKASRSTGSSGRFWRVSACVNRIPRSPDGLLITNLRNIYLSWVLCFLDVLLLFFRDKFDIKNVTFMWLLKFFPYFSSLV